MSNPVVSGSSEAFASQNVRLTNDAFGYLLNILRPKELVLLEKVCKSWKTFIDGQWKKQCQYRLNIPSNIDPSCFLPAGWNYKKGALLASTKVFDGRMYQYYLGADVGPVPPIPEEISLERGDEPDPCDSTNTIGRNYTWFYCPEGFTFEDPPFDLDKADDPIDEEAPGLIPKEAGKSEEKRLLTVPNTINNIGEIFKHPKNGNASAYNYDESIWDAYVSQHGDKRSPLGWVCMKEEVIRRDLSYAAQKKAAKNAGVVIPPLLHRILFNFLKQMDSGTYPDRRDPWTYARTSTLFHDLDRINCYAVCGLGDAAGLLIKPSYLVFCPLGAAVALPVKV